MNAPRWEKIRTKEDIIIFSLPRLIGIREINGYVISIIRSGIPYDYVRAVAIDRR